VWSRSPRAPRLGLALASGECGHDRTEHDRTGGQLPMTRHHLRELDLSVVLGPDECTGIAEWLLNPLQPRWAVEYWSTCKAIGATSEEQLSRLKLHWTEGTELLTLLGYRTCSELCTETTIFLGYRYYDICITPTIFDTLGMLASYRSLTSLRQLALDEDRSADHPMGGFDRFAAGLSSGSFPSLEFLRIEGGRLQHGHAVALVSVFTPRVLPKLKILSLDDNNIGDAGLIALAPALRGMAKLERLYLYGNNISDQGVGALVAKPASSVASSVFPSLSYLFLDGNQITNKGMKKLKLGLTNGAMPALRVLNLQENKVTPEGCAGGTTRYGLTIDL